MTLITYLKFSLRIGHPTTQMCKLIFFIDPTEKVICTDIVDLDELELLFYISYGRKIGISCSQLESNFQICLCFIHEIITIIMVLFYLFIQYYAVLKEISIR